MTDLLIALSVTAPISPAERPNWRPSDRRRILSEWPPPAMPSALRRLQLVTDAALSHLDLDDLLAELLTRFARTSRSTPWRSCCGTSCATSWSPARSRRPRGRGRARHPDPDRQADSRAGSPQNGGRCVLDDVDHADVLNPLLREKGIKSLAGVPLVFAKARARRAPRRISMTLTDVHQEEVDLLEIVADRVALAIEHARLFDAERGAAARLERVQSVMDTALAKLGLRRARRGSFWSGSGRSSTSTRSDPAARRVERTSSSARAAVGLEEEVDAGVRIPVGGGFAGSNRGRAPARSCSTT